jgi:hypothetical protein
MIDVIAGANKAQLGALCEALVLFREQQDREGQEQLYRDTLQLLSGGDEQVRRDGAGVLAVSSSRARRSNRGNRGSNGSGSGAAAAAAVAAGDVAGAFLRVAANMFLAS